MEPVSFVEHIGVRKDGKGYRKKTHKHHWVPCSKCGSTVLTNRYASKCRMTPGCEGKYTKPSLRNSEADEGSE